MTITQGGNKVNNLTLNDAKAGSVTVTDNAVDSTKDLILQAVKATALTVNNAAKATIDLTGDVELTTITLKGAGAATLKNVETLTAKVVSIDASGSTGAVTTSLNVTGVASVAQKFTGGTGMDTLTVATNAFSYGSGVLLTGGSGSTDIIVANYASAATDLAKGNTASVKGFEFLGLGSRSHFSCWCL